MLLDRGGSITASGAVPTPFTRRGGGVEMEVGALEGALAAAVAGLGPARERVAGVGVAGMAESGAPMVGGRAGGPVLAWFDGRGEETVARLTAALGPQLALRIGQRLRSVSTVAKLGWLLDRGAPVPDRWLGVPELALFLLTGAEATECSLAARTGAYDVGGRRYLPEVAEALGCPAAVFPPVLPAGAVMGRVSADGAARCGVPPGVPVTVAGHDHLVGAEAVGADDGDLLNSVGTAETLLRRTPVLPDVERALALNLAVTLRPGGSGWGVLAGAARSGLVLERAAAALGRTLAELDRMAETAAREAAEEEQEEGVDAGLIERLQAGEAGDPLPPGRPGVVWGGLLRALAERSVAAGERLCTLLGAPPRMIVFGGGSRSRPWLAAKAAVAGCPVLRSAVADAPARGAALAAGVAAGWWPAPSAAPAPSLEPVPAPPASPAPRRRR